MKKCFLFSAKTDFFGLLFSALIVSGTAQGQGFSAETEARLQSVLNSFAEDPAHPFVGGMSASIKIEGVDKWSGASGHASRNVDAQNVLLPGGVPFTTATLSRMYSITKTFTAALILQLAEEGKLNLEAPVSQYLPLAYVNPSLNSTVTVRQLLAHESGYSDYVDEYMFQIAVAYNPSKVWSPLEVAYFTRQLVEPGTVRRYSSTNYILLGAIAEVVTQTPLAKLYRDRFFVPLDLHSTYLAVFETEAQNGKSLQASPHDNLSPYNPLFMMLGRPTFPDAYTNVAAFDFTGIASAAFAGGGLVASIDDLVEWGSALYNGRATSKAVLNQMLKSISATPEPDGDYLGYGIIKNSRTSDTEVFVGHNGRAPGYRAVMVHQPDKNITIAVLTNFAGANAYAIARALYAEVSTLYQENQVELCMNGKSMLVNHHAVPAMVAKGAVLGSCSSSSGANGARLGQPALGSDALQLNAYPNPAGSLLNFSFRVPAAGAVRLQIMNIRGEVIATVYEGQAQEGEVKTITWAPAPTVTSGMYIGRLSTPAGTTNQRVLLSR